MLANGFAKFQHIKITATFFLVLLLIPLFQGCTNNIDNEGSGESTSVDVSGSGDSSLDQSGSSSLLTLSRVLQSNSDPTSTLDLIGDGSGTMGNYCTSSGDDSSATGGSTCTCQFSCTTASGTEQQWEVDTSYFESNLIRCPYDFSSCSTEEVTITIHMTNSDSYSNEVEYDISETSDQLDLSEESSFKEVKRFQCKDTVTIPYMWDSGGSGIYDPFQSESSKYSYPRNFYTTSVGLAVKKFYENSIINSTFYSDQECALNQYNSPEWENLRIYSVGSGGDDGDKTIFDTIDSENPRATFYLAKEETGIFDVAVHAYALPGKRSTEADEDGNYPSGEYSPLGYGTSPIATADGEKCPEEYVEVPEGYQWVKLWAFRASLEPRQYVKYTTEVAESVGIACNPGNYNQNADDGSTAQGTPVFRDCSPYYDSDGDGDDEWIYDNYNPLESFYQDSYEIDSGNNMYQLAWTDADDACIAVSEDFNADSYAYPSIPDGTYTTSQLQSQLETTLNAACTHAADSGSGIYDDCNCEDIEVTFHSDPTNTGLYGHWSFTLNDEDLSAGTFKLYNQTGNDFIWNELGFTHNLVDRDTIDDDGQPYDDDDDTHTITSQNAVEPNEYNVPPGGLAARITLGDQMCFAFTTKDPEGGATEKSDTLGATHSCDPSDFGPTGDETAFGVAGQANNFACIYQDQGADTTISDLKDIFDSNDSGGDIDDGDILSSMDSWERIGGLNEDIDFETMSFNVGDLAVDDKALLDKGSFDPWSYVRDPTYPDTNLGDRTIPYDASENFFYGELDGGIARFDYVFVVSPTDVMRTTMKNKDSGYEPYYPYTFRTKEDCNPAGGDPDADADCINNAARKVTFDLWSAEISANPDAADEDPERDPIYPVCAIQPE